MIVRKGKMHLQRSQKKEKNHIKNLQFITISSTVVKNDAAVAHTSTQLNEMTEPVEVITVDPPEMSELVEGIAVEQPENMSNAVDYENLSNVFKYQHPKPTNCYCGYRR